MKASEIKDYKGSMVLVTCSASKARGIIKCYNVSTSDGCKCIKLDDGSGTPKYIRHQSIHKIQVLMGYGN